MSRVRESHDSDAMRYWLTAVLISAAIASACSSKSPVFDQSIRVAAAADLSHAFTELAKEFRTKTDITVDIEYEASGTLAHMIERGAPFALFAAADRGFIDQVVKAGKCDGASVRTYARGRLVVWTPSGVPPPTSLADLTHERFKQIAIANPDRAPYGRAAKQALETAGIWRQVEDRIRLGENVSTTMTLARQGEAQVALVALSLAAVTDGGASLPIDPSMHAPLDQAMVVCGQGADADAAKQFAEFVGSQDGSEVMTRYGFMLPSSDGHPPKTP